MNPRCAVIIPTYNSARFVGRAVESVLGQTRGDLEVIVTDNASSDDTLESVKRAAHGDPRLRILKGERNEGPALNWLRGARAAVAPVAGLLFSDDWYEPGFVERALPFLEREDVGIVFSGVRTVGDEGPSKTTAFLGPGAEIRSSAEVLRGNLGLVDFRVPVSPGAALCRTSDMVLALSRRLPCYRPLRCMQHGAGPDLMVYLTCCEERSSVAYLGEPLVNYRRHAGNLSREAITRLAYFATRCEYYDSFPARSVSLSEHMTFRAWGLVSLLPALARTAWWPRVEWRHVQPLAVGRRLRVRAAEYARRRVEEAR